MKLLGERFVEELPGLTDRTVEALRATMPELTDLLEVEFLRAAVAMTNKRIADHLRGTTSAGTERPHVRLGGVAAQTGLSPEALDAAYRLGARLAWEVTTRLAAELAIPAGAALELAELHVAYVDQLFTDSLIGFRSAAEAKGLALARERQALLEAILGGGDLAEAAAAACWQLPDSVVGYASFPSHALVGRANGTTIALLDAEASVDATAPLALGAPVRLQEADVSLAQARRLAALAAEGHAPGDGLLRWHDHLPALVVHADPAAADALARQRLAPLDRLPPTRRHLLLETLAAWTAHPGQPKAMARTLHLHPQTVRYRVARLREHFGGDLDDPAARFELALALRAARTRVVE